METSIEGIRRFERDGFPAPEPVFDDALTRVVAGPGPNRLDPLRAHPNRARAEAAGALKLHGWVYDFVSGETYGADHEGRFAPLG